MEHGGPGVRAATAATIATGVFAVGALLLPVFDRAGDADRATAEAEADPTATTIAPDAGPLRLTKVAGVTGPVALGSRPGDDDLYLATLDGTVRRLTTEGAGLKMVDEPVLDLRGFVLSGQGEQGLFDVVFTVDGSHVLVSYTDRTGALVVDAFPVADRVLTDADGAEIIRVPQIRDNHNGGGIVFGPDGLLYLGLGDGGSNDGPSAVGSLVTSQETSNLFGTLLRIEPDVEAGGYAVPDDNPFVGGPGRDEIWLYGLRNPFRQSFDADGSLWIPDVGGADREEINRFDGPDPGRGANLGWGRMEGSIPVLDGTPPPGHDPPEFEYTHAGGRCAVIGGVRVEGDRYPGLTGRFLFSDFCGGGLLSLVEGDDGVLVEDEIQVEVDGAERLGSVVAVEQPNDVVYVVDLDGNVYRLDGS